MVRFDYIDVSNSTFKQGSSDKKGKHTGTRLFFLEQANRVSFLPRITEDDPGFEGDGSDPQGRFDTSAILPIFPIHTRLAHNGREASKSWSGQKTERVTHMAGGGWRWWKRPAHPCPHQVMLKLFVHPPIQKQTRPAPTPGLSAPPLLPPVNPSIRCFFFKTGQKSLVCSKAECIFYQLEHF